MDGDLKLAGEIFHLLWILSAEELGAKLFDFLFHNGSSERVSTHSVRAPLTMEVGEIL